MYSTSVDLGIVLIGTKETSNHLSDQYGAGQYTNVTAFRAIEKLNLDALRMLDDIKVEDKLTAKGDSMDGLIVAMDMIARHVGTKKYKKRIFVITDGEKEAKFDEQERKTVIRNMNESDTRLNVITLDFCDELAEDEEDEDDDVQKQQPKANAGETKA